MSGIDDLRRRRQAAAAPPPRRLPAPLRPRTTTAAAPAEAATSAASGEAAPALANVGRAADADPLVALGVRVPRSLDDRLAVLGVELRMRGIRLTKAELVAHALRQLPASATDEFASAVSP